MKGFKKLLSLTLASAVLLVGCGTNKEQKAEHAQTSEKKSSITVGATPNPHAEILNAISPLLEKDGIKLEVKIFSDYKIPNTEVDDGTIDANFFQHQPYLDEFQKNNGTKLKTVAKVHVEPMSIYSKKVKSLDELQDGATVSIPNDPTNGGRALILLEKQGLITIKDGVEKLTATDKDIDKNPKNLKFTLLDAAQLPRTLDEVDISVINTNYALEGGINPTKDALVVEDKDSPYANILVVKEGDENNESIQALVKALNSEEAKKFIEETYDGAVVPAF